MRKVSVATNDVDGEGSGRGRKAAPVADGAQGVRVSAPGVRVAEPNSCALADDARSKKGGEFTARGGGRQSGSRTRADGRRQPTDR